MLLLPQKSKNVVFFSLFLFLLSPLLFVFVLYTILTATTVSLSTTYFKLVVIVVGR